MHFVNIYYIKSQIKLQILMQYIRYVKYQHFELCHFFYQYQQK
jgi:hypothetical protein